MTWGTGVLWAAGEGEDGGWIVGVFRRAGEADTRVSGEGWVLQSRDEWWGTGGGGGMLAIATG